MQKTRSRVFLAAILVAMAATAMLILASTAYANPLFFPLTAQTNTATTSPAYMTPGTATSTLTYDSYAVGQPKANDFATLLVQFAGSSTAAVLGLNFEYSQDGIDWYKDNIVGEQGAVSTTSPTIIPSITNSISWTFASSTPGGVAVTNANSATSTKAFKIPVPVRFVRVIHSITGANGAVWSQIVPARQSN